MTYFSSPFPGNDVLTLSLCITVIYWRIWKFVTVYRRYQTWAVYSTGNKVSKQNDFKLKTEKWYKGQDLLSHISNKEINWHVKTNCLHFVKIDKRVNKSGINVKTSLTRKRWQIWKKNVYLHFLLQIISPTTQILNYSSVSLCMARERRHGHSRVNKVMPTNWFHWTVVHKQLIVSHHEILAFIEPKVSVPCSEVHSTSVCLSLRLQQTGVEAGGQYLFLCPPTRSDH